LIVLHLTTLFKRRGTTNQSCQKQQFSAIDEMSVRSSFKQHVNNAAF